MIIGFVSYRLDKADSAGYACGDASRELGSAHGEFLHLIDVLNGSRPLTCQSQLRLYVQYLKAYSSLQHRNRHTRTCLKPTHLRVKIDN